MAVGWVVLGKEPRNLVGTTICLQGLLPLLIVSTATYTAVVEADPGALPVFDLAVTLAQGDWMLLYVPSALLLLLFPDGHRRAAAGGRSRRACSLSRCCS